MNEKKKSNYDRIAETISYIKVNFKNQPKLEDVANQINLSPFHFQRLFIEWVGVSPKKFLQYITVEHAKKLLKKNLTSLEDTAFESGLSGTSRLHDLFVNIEGMTPGEYKNAGKNLYINYSYLKSLFGNMLVASTYKGICHLSFIDDEKIALNDLYTKFPNAKYERKSDLRHQNILKTFTNDWKNLGQIKLHLKGTEFQLKIWESLLKIPIGRLSTYGEIANKINHPKASRAVGAAIGENPIAFLIPCHRVIRSTGVIGEYRWGNIRKTAIIAWESSRIESEIQN